MRLVFVSTNIPDAYKIFFVDCISKIIITDGTRPEMIESFNKLNLHAEVVFKKGKRGQS